MFVKLPLRHFASCARLQTQSVDENGSRSPLQHPEFPLFAVVATRPRKTLQSNSAAGCRASMLEEERETSAVSYWDSEMLHCTAVGREAYVRYRSVV